MNAARFAAVVAAISVSTAVLLPVDAGESAAATTAGGGRTPVPCDADALADAIKQANGAGGGALDLTAGCTYTLVSPQPGTIDGLPPVTAPIRINGHGATITRSASAGTPAFRVFEVPSASGALTISALTLSNGQTTGADSGAGVFVHDRGTFVATASYLTHNGSGYRGGGIFNDKGSVRISDSTVASNNAFSGGGIDIEDGDLTVSRTSLRDNTVNDPAGGGGALFNLLGTVTLADSTVSGNSGDAVANFEHMRVERTTFRDNTGRAGAALNNVGDLVVNRSLITQNRTTELGGGGIINFQISGILGTARIEDSTISGNTAATSGGGVFVDGGAVTLTRSSVIDNRAANAPGGITNDNGEVALNRSFVAGNSPTNCAGSPKPIAGCDN